AVNGRAENIGGQIALLSDAALAVEVATFGDHHLDAGIAAGDGGTMMWPLLVGMARARDIVLRGGTLSAREAHDLHLVVEVVSASDLLDRAISTARSMAAAPPLAFAATKLALNRWWQLSATFAWDQSLAYEAAALV